MKQAATETVPGGPGILKAPIRVCFWTTTFQADILTLARFLDRHPRFEPLVVLEDPASFQREPIYGLLPLSCRLVDINRKDCLETIRAFAPHITIVDNHFPPKKLSSALFVLWHGFGWRGPNDRREFAQVHRHIRQLTGKRSDAPNPLFIWQCYGPTDYLHRHQVSGFHQDSLRILGMAMIDDLAPPVISREQALAFFPERFRSGKIALLAFTWHHGRIFSHWGEDGVLMQRLFSELDKQGLTAILRMHDRKRYEPDYLGSLENMVEKHPGVMLKFKDTERDNLLDLIVSDVLISNFSSILNPFYYTGRPSLHIYPVAPDQEDYLQRVWKRGKVRQRAVPSADYIWKLAPEENGGILVGSFDSLLEAIHTAVREPDCCRERSRAFLKTHMVPAGGACQRIAEALIELAGRL